MSCIFCKTELPAQGVKLCPFCGATYRGDQLVTYPVRIYFHYLRNDQMVRKRLIQILKEKWH